MSGNTKYEITNIQHPVFFDLYRIRALRDIGDDVKAGDLGGFVENEKNLSFEPGDNAWIYDDAHASGNARVDENSMLRDQAAARDNAYVTGGAELYDCSSASGQSAIRGGVMKENALLLHRATVSATAQGRPVLSGQCVVYGTVTGPAQVTGHTQVPVNRQIVCKDRQTEMKERVISDFNRERA